ncbi:MAG: hypothetical protein GY716_01515, partial [bacterium]|nr:hypothetical protein [bacterium]
FAFFVRDPSVRMDLVFPDGRSFANDNPSGNQEWEQFLVTTDATCDASAACIQGPVPGGLDPDDPVGLPCADACLAPASAQIPPGVYEARVEGVDMFNLNALRLPQILCVDEIGTPCVPLRDLLLGDTVFLDEDGNGIQDGGDAGIPGVVVKLLGNNGGLAGVTTTDASGNYQFEVDSGVYTVQVAPENFAMPGPAGGTVGDRVWLDVDGGGTDNGGTEPGLANIKVNLFEEAGVLDIFLATTTTDANGNYAFTDLPAGTYYTDVADITLPDGLSLSGGTDPSATRTILGT